MSEISIIIITYNRPQDLLELLQNIQSLSGKDPLLKEVIIVNNASSSDYTPVKEFINANPSTRFKFIDAPSNLGVSGGRNFAADLASGDIFLFLDDDVIVEDMYLLSAVVNGFNRIKLSGRETGVLCFRVRYYSNRQVQINAFPHKDYERMKDEPWFFTAYFVGCGHAILRKTWLDARRYPEDFFYGMEEYDLSYRIIDADYAIGYDASIEIFHKESPEGRKPRAEQLKMMWINKSTVAWRYLPILYFVTTAVAWSGFYLVNSNWQLNGFFSGWAAVFNIPFRQPRKTVSSSARVYLNKVKARLWF
jgi:GT2 family glycosyltransferase